MAAQAKPRESGIELLRLVCMFYIILHHFIVHGLGLAGYDNGMGMTDSILNGFFVIAVNCFILISGYFGIKPRWRGITRLYVMCAFYSVGLYLLAHWPDIYLRGFAASFLAFTNSGWFIGNYIILYMLAPLLNRLIDNLNKKEFITALLTLGVIVFYFGFARGMQFSAGGYNFFNFIFIYLIGRFMALFMSVEKTRKARIAYCGIYAVSSVLIGLGAFYIANRFFSYNDPLVILSSVAFFLLFRSLNFSSRAVNYLAGSALAVYLIHENFFVGHSHLYPLVCSLGERFSGIALAPVLLALALCVLLSCLLIDKVRMVITDPVERLLNRIDFDSYCNAVIRKIESAIK